MNTQIGLIFKVLVISIGLSFAIKYGAPYFAIAPTPINALIAILLFPILIALILAWQSRKQIS